MNTVVIVSATRTPIGSFLGTLSNIQATELAAISLRQTIKNININPSLIEEVFFGNVFQSGLGQSPARQVGINSGIPTSVPCTTINKVCASGTKSIIIGTQSILSGDNDVVVVGGMENMSQVPFYLKNLRTGQKMGDKTLIDGLLIDGLIDVYSQKHMGFCAEKSANKYNISREIQDQYTIQSYRRAKNAWKKGKFNEEVVPISVKLKNKKSISLQEDEEFKKINFNKINSLPAVFKNNGTITSANSSPLSDGASSLILMSEKKAKSLLINPLAKIISYADTANDPLFFTTAPASAIILALKKAKLSIDDIDYFEINEAFSLVPLINQKILNIDPNKLNIHGGAVSLGHPIGNSGARIVVTLINILKQRKSQFGAIAICNGGGGASALIIENLN